MKKTGAVGLTVLTLALILILGSCTQAAPIGDTPVLEEASSSFLLKEDAGQDCTAFLVGEFTGGSGGTARFDGCGNLTLVRGAEGDLHGSYTMRQYENGRSVVTVEMDGISTQYSFVLLSGSGNFTLTDSSNREYTFTPVQY